MSREGPGFIHVVRPTSAGHDTSSSNRSNSALGNVEHIRVGRGYVKVKTYENEASRGAARSPVSPTSPTSTQSPTVSGRTRKQKLLQLLKPKKNSLAGALSAEQELTPSIKRGEIRSWVDRQARERWDSTSQTDSEARTEFSDVRRDESDRDSALTPTISFVAPQPELSTSPYSDGSSSSIRTSISYDTSASFPRLSPLQNYMARNQEEQDADGRAYLDAVIGFERPTTVPEEEYLPQPQINNLSDPIPDPNEPATEIDHDKATRA
ncbi:hypothetical protein FRC07_001389 [Ceratobasidium sp. 392]|nr:hypothetical protein FRC07_001389 [Ceratobasidium sp. 392]